MAGITRGSIEHRVTVVTEAGVRNTWTLLYNFLASHPNVTEIANNYGNAGTGFDLTGGPNPSGDNAWAVFRFDSAVNVWYCLIQWCWTSAVGTAPGDPGTGDNGEQFGCFVQFACDSSGGNPWNGGTVMAGADSKSTPVWVPNGGNLLVFPRSNSAGGADATNREALFQWADWTPQSNGRAQFYADDDSLRIYRDQNDDGTYNTVTYFGPYVPKGVTPDTPLVMLGGDLSGGGFNIAQLYGVAAGNTAFGGGIVAKDSADGVRTLRLDRADQLLASTHQPNEDAAYTRAPIPVASEDSQGAGTFGPLGQIEQIREVANVATLSTFDSLVRAVYGSGTLTHVKVCDEGHDGATAPGSGVTEAGVQFP